MEKNNNYKIKFTQSEFDRFNKVRFLKQRDKLMSLYQYLLCASESYGSKFEYLDRSLNELLLMLNSRKKKKETKRSTLADLLKQLRELDLLKQLRELDLLSVIPSDGTIANVYYFNRVKKVENIDINLDNKEVISDTKSDTKSDSSKQVISMAKSTNSDTQLINNKNNNKTSIYTTEYFENLEKVKDFNELKEDLEEAFKLLKIRKGKLKNTVINNLKWYYPKITKKYAFEYICKCINSLKVKFQLERDKYIYNLTKARNLEKQNNKKSLKFTNYKQREYNYKTLEDEVLGWC